MTDQPSNPESRIPAKPSLDGVEAKWDRVWEENEVYKFDRTKNRDEVFSIDTPPPTVSGSLHMGSLFGYVQTDAIARFQRMNAKMVFYPMGWDDNGLPTERRVQNYYGVNCDPTVPYDPNMATPAPVEKKGQKPLQISRKNFVELCLKLVVEDEKVFESVWRRAGLSVDWSMTYSSIDKKAQRVSQRAFLRNLERGEAYQAEAPTMWDVDFQTAVAQAEVEDREIAGAYHRLAFRNGDEIVPVDTTRPELLPACVGVVVHPDDARYKHLHGKKINTALFGVEVEVQPSELADPEKGTGAVMVCTFGDATDVAWWRQFGWPTRTIVQRNGRLGDIDWTALTTDRDNASALYDELRGLKVKAAQQKIVELLQTSGEMIGDPRPITHPVKFFEKGDKPLELVSSRQWFIKIMDSAADFVERSKELDWHPPHMQHRFENWANGLNTDWLISRQRYFGVPFPVWYRLDGEGQPIYDNPIVPSDETLPIDPAADVPEGYDESQRNQPNGFAGDPDIMDTWATSSLTPQIATGWMDDEDLHRRTYPMDLRPQGPEIIRTWLFDTVVRAQYETGALPWAHTSINGWILDPDRKKMSKSKGNVVTPDTVLDEFGTDAVRHWATSARQGADTALDPNQMKVGRRLAIKILNASKFVLGFPAPGSDAQPTLPIDKALVSRLTHLVQGATTAFENFDYARSLELTEQFFWAFCDDYLELVKARAYGSQGDAAAESARATLNLALETMLHLFAPFLPFVTEEVWSWTHDTSIHASRWPVADEVSKASANTDGVLKAASAVVAEIRRAKSEAKVSMRAEVSKATVVADESVIDQLRQANGDITEAGTIGDLDLTVQKDGVITVKVELA